VAFTANGGVFKRVGVDRRATPAARAVKRICEP